MIQGTGSHSWMLTTMEHHYPSQHLTPPRTPQGKTSHRPETHSSEYITTLSDTWNQMSAFLLELSSLSACMVSGAVWGSITKTAATWSGSKTQVSLLAKLLTCQHLEWLGFNISPHVSLSECGLLQRYAFVFWNTHDWMLWLSLTSCPKLSTTSPPLLWM